MTSMRTNRRHLIQSTLGLSAVVGFGNLSAALAAEASSVAALKAAGLDPLETYARMFASTTKGAEVAWWFEGALPRDIEDVGPVDTIQEETVRIHRTESYGSGKLEFIWKEVGVFRDIRTGENPPERFDPVSGATSKAGTLLGGGGHAAKVTITKSGDALIPALETGGNTVGAQGIKATVEGNRVCFTHFEDKTRAAPQGGMAPTNRTVFKIYANIDDLKGKPPSVAASGFYGVKAMATGKVFVNGLMHKAGMDEKLNPIAYARLKAAFPTFFKGDRFAPDWES